MVGFYVFSRRKVVVPLEEGFLANLDIPLVASSGRAGGMGGGPGGGQASRLMRYRHPQLVNVLIVRLVCS